jgi:hypothetical protein
MEIVRNCPAGHRIEFALPATTLYLDIHWLGSGTIIDLFDAYGINCPSGPVKVGRVEFRGAALRLLDLHSGLGEGAGVFRLYAGGDPDLPGRPRVKPSRSTEYHSEPWVEDDTMLKRIPDVRSYRLYYPGASGGPDYMIRITCSGEFSHRECATDDSFDGSSSYEAFYISYHLPQNKLPIPPMSQLYPTDPTTEPGALLQFNAHFRAWLATLKQKP